MLLTVGIYRTHLYRIEVFVRSKGNGRCHGAEEEDAQDAEHHKEFDEDDDPQLASPRHLPEAFDVEIYDSAKEIHGFEIAVWRSQPYRSKPLAVDLRLEILTALASALLVDVGQDLLRVNFGLDFLWREDFLDDTLLVDEIGGA